MPAVAPLDRLSTTTLVAALRHEPNWDTQIELAEMIAHRSDVFNLIPLLELLLEAQQNRSVQKAVARCVSRHGFAQAFHWMERRILNPGGDTKQKLLAMHALANFGRPAETVPFFARLCCLDVPAEVRSAGFFHLVQGRVPWGLIALVRLVEADQKHVVEEAQRAMNICLKQAGGVPGAVSQLVKQAVVSARQGNGGIAEQLLWTAMQLSERNPGSEGQIYRELRSHITA